MNGTILWYHTFFAVNSTYNSQKLPWIILHSVVNAQCEIALEGFCQSFWWSFIFYSQALYSAQHNNTFLQPEEPLMRFWATNLSVCLAKCVFSCTRLICAEGNCSECFPLGEKPCCLQSESVEPMLSIKKYGTSSVAMEINSIEAAFKPQEDIIEWFGFHSRDTHCNSVVVVICCFPI